MTIPTVVRDVEQLGYSFTAVRNEKWFSHFGIVCIFKIKLNRHII